MSTPDLQNTEAAGYDVQDSTVGIRLQLLREQKGLSIQEVSEETHISASNLKAIEGENYDQLPADTFIRGLVTIYGNFLGIDGAEAARIFLRERDNSQPRGWRSRPGRGGHSLSPKKLAEPSHISSATIATILLLLIVVSFSAFCLYTGWNPFGYFLGTESRTTEPSFSRTLSSETEEMATESTVLPAEKQGIPPVHTSPDSKTEN